MWPALIILGGLMIALLYGINVTLPKESMYDCRLAEISPDFTSTMRDECRKKLKESTK